MRESDEEMLEILQKVWLGSLAVRMGGGDEHRGLGVHRDWSKVLSLGEQQRLAFARVLYNRHSLSVVVLDEATSALDAEAERERCTPNWLI
jgi:putative ATP-binding cassette transporter